MKNLMVIGLIFLGLVMGCDGKKTNAQRNYKLEQTNERLLQSEKELNRLQRKKHELNIRKLELDHEKEVRELKEKHKHELTNATKELEKEILTLKVKHSEKVQTLKENYERKIKGLEEQLSMIKTVGISIGATLLGCGFIGGLIFVIGGIFRRKKQREEKSWQEYKEQQRNFVKGVDPERWKA